MSGKGGHRLASGVYAALLTPRDPDGTEADASALLEYLDRVAKAGVDGLVFFGSTGEFVHFDIEERIRVLSLAVRRSRVPVLVNVSHSTMAGALELADHAAGAGASGLLLMPPYFYRFDDDLIAEFFTCFLDDLEMDIPVYLYNLPQSTQAFSTTLLQRLLSSGSFAGIKSSDPDWDNFQALLELRRQQPFQVLVGNERLLLKGLLQGADGSVSGIASAIPELPVAICRALKAGESQAASALSEQLHQLLSWIEKLPPLLALKQVAEARSWLRFTPALPLDANTRHHLGEFRRWLEEWLPSTLEQCRAAAQAPVRT